MVSATIAVASRARPPTLADETTRYRFPLVLDLEPVTGSSTSIVSADDAIRSASATSPNFSSRRAPMGRSLHAGAPTPLSRPAPPVGRARWPHHDAQLPQTGAARRHRERGQQHVRLEPQLLAR